MAKLSKACKAIREQRGLASRISERLKLSRAAVSSWIQVPVDHVGIVAEMLEWSRHDVRPDRADLFPKP